MVSFFSSRVLIFLWIIFGCLQFSTIQAQPGLNHDKPRIIITADPELDDNNSLIRLLLYSNEIDIEGLIYASSQFHWKGDGKGTKWYVPGREYARFGLDTCPCPSWRWAKGEQFIHDAVEAYAQVYPNLKMHDPAYPGPSNLKAIIRYGNIEFDGDYSKDSPGSELVEALMLDNKPGKLFITAWGGQSTIARALKSIEEKYINSVQWEQVKNKIYRKVVLLPSGDQDDTYAMYIKPHWPGIEYRQFSGGPNYGYGAQLRASADDSVYLTASWMKDNVSGRGPLGALYRVWGDGRQMVKGDRMDFFGFEGMSNEQLRSKGYVVWMPVQEKGSWLGEGDNHTFMNMLGNGLRAYEQASYGGWGGRGLPTASEGISFHMSDTSQQAMVSALGSINERSSNGDAYPNFFPAAQRDFAARLKWSVTPKYSGANHSPQVRVEGPLMVMASPGQTIRLNGLASDPDGDKVETGWWIFNAGSYKGEVEIIDANTPGAKVKVPKDALPGQTIHVILQATDNGTPGLTKYQRVIITVRAT